MPSTTMTDDRRGFFGHGDMQKEFEDAAFRLKKGQISEIVDTASGLHLIQRLAHVGLLGLFFTDSMQNRLE
jgi:parvulin-like peptidyl-prolyl isomerase